jgi:hypothetical protein
MWHDFGLATLQYLALLYLAGVDDRYCGLRP